MLVEREIGYPGGMIALISFVLTMLISPFDSRSRLRPRRGAPTAVDCFAAQGEESSQADERRPLVSVQLYRWFPSMLDVLTVIPSGDVGALA